MTVLFESPNIINIYILILGFMKGELMMFSNTFNNLVSRQGEKHCNELSKGDAFAVIHEITKVRTLSAVDKFNYIQNFMTDVCTIQKLKAMIVAQTDDSGLY
jgi:hypothetical protein